VDRRRYLQAPLLSNDRVSSARQTSPSTPMHDVVLGADNRAPAWRPELMLIGAPSCWASTSLSASRPVDQSRSSVRGEGEK